MGKQHIVFLNDKYHIDGIEMSLKLRILTSRKTQIQSY